MQKKNLSKLIGKLCVLFFLCISIMSSDFPESLDELFPQIASMSESDKVLKLARHMPCDQCDCQGWRPNFSMEFSNDCFCGHDTEHHVDHKQDFVRRLKVALRIDELLEV